MMSKKSKKNIICVMLLILIICVLAACSKENNEKKENSESEVSYEDGYHEKDLTLPENVTHIQDMCIKQDGTLMILGTDTEQTIGDLWELQGGVWNEKFSYMDLIRDKLPEHYSLSTAISTESEVGIVVETDSEIKCYLINNEQEIKEMNDLSNIENISNATVDFTPNGNLLLVTPTQIYLIDKETGRIKQEYLDGKSMINAYDCIEEGICIICNGQLICLDYDSGRKISPSGIKEIAENIKKLDITGNSNLKFLKKDGRISALCYLDAYATDAPGLVEVTSRGYRGLVDGSRTYYGHYDYLLSILEADDKGNIYSVFWGEPEKIMQYAYEKNNEKATKQLKIYSLRDSRVIRQNMLIYQQKNPDIDIIYEIGIGNNAERTEQDAIKNLNTEIAAGTGPDIIVLDGLRMEEYIKQGVLEDVSDVVKNIGEKEELIENVVNLYNQQDKTYAIPMRYSYMTVENQKMSNMFGTFEDFEQLTDKVMALDTKNDRLFDPFSFDHILSISYWTYLCDSLLDENGQLVDNSQENIKQYYELIKLWYDKVDMTEAASKNLTEFSLSPYSYRNYEDEEHGKPQISVDYITSEWDYQYLLENNEVEYTLLKNENEIFYIPACIMSINSKSKNQEEAKKILEFMLSKEGQLAEQYVGCKVNKDAIRENLNNDELKRFSLIGREFSEMEKEAIMQGAEQLNKSVDTDSVLMNMVLEGAEDVIKGKSTSEETAENVEKKLKLYLLE